jgi:hypothetical protein
MGLDFYESLSDNTLNAKAIEAGQPPGFNVPHTFL